MAKTQLPPFQDLLNTIRTTSLTQPLADVLSLLFEPSPILLKELVPQLKRLIATDSESRSAPINYEELVDQALSVVHGWEWDQKAQFVGGHPRIGEVKGLSTMSAAEQGQLQAAVSATATAPQPTPPEVLERLKYLNRIYERRYPGLVYITFVNGRSRGQIKDEMEERMLAEHVLNMKDAVVGSDEVQALDVNGDVWRKEVTRAVDDVGKIAKDRLKKLDVA